MNLHRGLDYFRDNFISQWLLIFNILAYSQGEFLPDRFQYRRWVMKDMDYHMKLKCYASTPAAV